MKSRPLATRILFLSAPVAPVIAGQHWSTWDRVRLPPPITDNRRALSPRQVVRVRVAYDSDFARDHAGKAEEVIAQALGILNVGWQRYRGEWFELADMQLQSSGDELDPSRVLASFLATAAEPSTIHVRIVGRQLEVYSDGRKAIPVGGLAFRGSDVLLVSVPANVTVELLAYYLFHEIGHLCVLSIGHNELVSSATSH